MEPKKHLKKHTLTEPEWTWNIQGPDLISRINEISAQILLDEAMRDYTNDLPEVEMGDLRVEGDTYIQDVTIHPKFITVDIPTDNLTITLTGDTWLDSS